MNAVLHEKRFEQYETVFTSNKVIEISGETVVPDKMPDIGLLGDTEAQVFLRAKHAESGAGVMEGELSVSVSFIPDGAAGFRVLRIELPWQAEFKSDNISDLSSAVGTVRVMQTDTRLLNPRKVLVKAKLLAELTVYKKQDTVIRDTVEDDHAVQAFTQTMECSVVSAVCERTFAATDEYPLPPNMTDGEIIWKSVQFRVEDIKTLTNKLIVKGSVLSDVIMASESGDTEKISFTSGFSFIAETECEDVSNDVAVSIMPTALYYEPSSNGRVLSVEVHGVCQMVVYEKMTMQYLADAFSNFYPCECVHDSLRVYSEMKFGTQRENAAGSISCRSQIASVRFLTVSHVMNDARETDNLGGQIGLCVRYENGMVDWIKKQITVPIKKKSTERVTAVRFGDVYGIAGGTEVDYHFMIDYDTCDGVVGELQPVSDIVLDEEGKIERECPSMMVVRSKGNLWELARRYGSTVSLIKTYNELDEDEVCGDTLLLIPRQRK